ncbi:MAG: c-type cytochrome [Rhodobacteraceae bacterium]|nr:c-type cytochrome [Paracoccaceae bacterium]
MTRHARLFHRAILSVPALAFALGIAGPVWAAAPQLATTTCSACHGVDGNSTDGQYPKLAGQKAGYLRLQLEAFRSGARPSAVMKPFAQSLTDAQIAELARYYSANREAPEKEPVAPDARRGAAIFRTGGGTGAACATCHATGGFGGGMMGGGMMGGGMMRTNPAVTPFLFAQHATYLAQQLDAFASGARPSTVMGPFATQLSPDDRKAVADYLASVR